MKLLQLSNHLLLLLFTFEGFYAHFKDTHVLIIDVST